MTEVKPSGSELPSFLVRVTACSCFLRDGDRLSRTQQRRLLDVIAQFRGGVSAKQHNSAIFFILIEYLGCCQHALSRGNAPIPIDQ
jgi:hypothetical protein